MSEVQKFWMGYVHGRNTPTKLYPIRWDAEAEAKRLAAQEHKHAFVLEAVAGYAMPEPEPIEITIVEDQPA